MKAVLMFVFLFSSGAFAQETTSTQEVKPDTVEKLVKEKKKDRKKKAHMCHDCGKPEIECTCKGH